MRRSFGDFRMDAATLSAVTSDSCSRAMAGRSSLTSSTADDVENTSRMCDATSPSVVFSRRALTMRAATSEVAFSAMYSMGE